MPDFIHFCINFFIKINYFSEKYISKFWKGHRIKKGQKWNKNKKKMVKFRFFIIFYWVFGYFWTFAPSQKFSYIFFLKCPNFLMILIKNIWKSEKKLSLQWIFIFYRSLSKFRLRICKKQFSEGFYRLINHYIKKQHSEVHS